MASPRKVAAKGVMAACVRVAVQRAVRAAATLCWRMAGAWRALARAKLLMKAAASSLHLPPTSIMLGAPNGPQRDVGVSKPGFHSKQPTAKATTEKNIL